MLEDLPEGKLHARPGGGLTAMPPAPGSGGAAHDESGAPTRSTTCWRCCSTTPPAPARGRRDRRDAGRRLPGRQPPLAGPATRLARRAVGADVDLRSRRWRAGTTAT
ncbi:MAG: hypothetical protein MZW92_59650 [Comamonadaceae bacterium]|nr:hypothetical protein [Comamonadaceae bacterium]